MLQSIVRISFTLAAAYLLYVALCFFLQRQMIFPGRYLSGPADPGRVPAPRAKLARKVHNDGISGSGRDGSSRRAGSRQGRGTSGSGAGSKRRRERAHGIG